MEQASGLAGLANIGNTCYANSVLQATRAIPLWSQLINLATPSEEADETSRKVFLAYQDIIRTLWSQQAVKGAVCRPMAFWKEFRESVIDTVYESFRQAIPHDAHEFLIYLLDQCHEALKVKAPADQSDLYGQLGGWTSPVVEQLFGWDRVECRCEVCDKASVRYEPFNMLKVGITAGATGLAELVRNERTPETLDDYVCEGCTVRTKATIRRTLHKLPKTLFYVLRRFTADGRKDISTITYDGAPVDFSELFEPGMEVPNQLYKPIATIDHMGSHLGGHYVAQIYHPLLQEWFIFDDEQSHRIQGAPHFGPMTYIIVLTAETNVTEATASTPQ